MQSSAATSSLLGSNTLSILSSNTLNQFSFVSVRDQVSHPYKTTGKIMILSMFIFESRAECLRC